MINKLIKIIILFAILMLPLLWLYMNTELGNSKKSHEIESLLLEIMKIDTELTEQVLKSRGQLTLHYDDIAISQRKLNELMDIFNPLLSNNISISQEDLSKINILASEIQNIVERFKSTNGQIRQRQMYLKYLCNEITLKVDTPSVIDEINTITFLVFKGRVFGENIFYNDFIRRVEMLAINNNETLTSNISLIESYILHFNKLALLESEETMLLDFIFKHEISKKIEVIKNNLKASQYQVIDNGNMVQRYLIVYAGLLVLLICGFIFNYKYLKKRNELHKKQSEVDELTKLNNRRCFLNDLNKVFLKHSGALFFIDLDGFKLINDSLGHKVGDEALQFIADRLNLVVDDINTTRYVAQAYRLGGDEFVISINNVLEDHNMEMLRRFSDQIVKGCEFELNDTYNLSVSVGVALYPEHGNDVTTVLNCADKAMYYSKSTGRNRFTFYKKSAK